MPNEPQSREPTPRPKPLRTVPSGGDERATIGRSITIRGEVSGDEDLLIQGRVDGSVDLKERTVTVGKEGKVKANVTGRMVTVEGEVEGDLIAHEQVTLRSSARVLGDITAPRVALEDGATFRGQIDMGATPAKGETASPVSPSAGKKLTEPTPSTPAVSGSGSVWKKDPEEAGSKSGA